MFPTNSKHHFSTSTIKSGNHDGSQYRQRIVANYQVIHSERCFVHDHWLALVTGWSYQWSQGVGCVGFCVYKCDSEKDIVKIKQLPLKSLHKTGIRWFCKSWNQGFNKLWCMNRNTQQWLDYQGNYCKRTVKYRSQRL